MDTAINGENEGSKGAVSPLGDLLGWRKRDRPATNELLVHQWTMLRALWAEAKNVVPPPADQPEIDALFEQAGGNSDAAGWAVFNDVELRVGAHLTSAQLPIEYGGLLIVAAARSLPTLDVHKKNEALVADTNAPIEARRSAYRALLGDLQADFIDGRHQRALRSEVAVRLFRYGLVAMLAAVLLPTLVLWLRWTEAESRLRKAYGLAADAVIGPNISGPALSWYVQEPIFAVTAVVSAGMLGAYFSRAMAFHASTTRFSFDEVMRLYIGKMLRIRLLYGMIGALVFYFVLRGGLVAGSIFPTLADVGIGVPLDWSKTVGGTPAAAKLTMLIPNADLAKLLVWAFIAGFSERLVPDTLTRTEAQGNKAP